MSLCSVELCGGVHTAQRQITTQIPIEFCMLVIGLGLGHCQVLLHYKTRLHVAPPCPSPCSSPSKFIIVSMVTDRIGSAPILSVMVRHRWHNVKTLTEMSTVRVNRSLRFIHTERHRHCHHDIGGRYILILLMDNGMGRMCTPFCRSE